MVTRSAAVGPSRGGVPLSHNPLPAWSERRRTLPMGALLCILRGLTRGRGWATTCDAVSCAVLVVTDRAGGVEGVVGRWQTVYAVGASGWLLVSGGAFFRTGPVGAEL